MRKIGIKVSAVTGMVVALEFASATVASAAESISGGAKTCSNGTFTTVASTAKGVINHKDGVTVRNSWNNGSTYQSRSSIAAATIPNWSAYITGIGGDVSSASAYCA